MNGALLFLSVLLFPFLLFSQNTLSGVVHEENNAIPGATIRLLNSSYATIAGVDGSYHIEDIAIGTYQLEVRAVGFKPHLQWIDITGPTSISVALQESTLTIDEVVVTGTMQPTFVSVSPVKIEVVTAKHLTTYLPAAASSLVEGISLVNGVQEVVACGVCFTNSISINGLPGPYTAILMDGSPIYGNLASVYGLNGIPSMIIDRFEVIKGPSSTLYGSEAVAGVINIITKDPANQPRISADIMGTSHMESFGNFSIAKTSGKSKGFVGLNYAYINDFDDENGDGFGDNINLDRISLFTKWNIHRKSGKQFTITGKYYYEDRRNGIESYLNDRNYKDLRGSNEIYGESILTHRFEIFGKYELPVSENIHVNYSLSTHDQDSYYGADHYLASQNILFTNLIWSKDIRQHQLTSGLTNRYQIYDDNTIATQMNGVNNKQIQYIPGVFLQDEWSVSQRVTLLAGGRIDHYKSHGLIFAPRLNVKYKPGEWTTLRSNFGTGFRIVNLFTEDHAFVTGQREVIIEEDLEPEESYNFSFNLNHIYSLGIGQGMIDIDVFHTHFTNKITPDYETDGKISYSNTNGYAVSQGIGINLQQEMTFPLALSLGVNVQQVREVENGLKRNIEFSPQWTGIFLANYEMKRWGFSVSYTGRVTGPMSLPEVFDLDATGTPLPYSRPTTSTTFAIHTVQFSKELNNRWKLYGGIQNLFDYRQPWSPLVGANDPNARLGFSENFDTAYAYSPIHGREFYVGFNWNIRNN